MRSRILLEFQMIQRKKAEVVFQMKVVHEKESFA